MGIVAGEEPIYDVMSPSDKFMHTDKDNVFTAFKWSKVDAMMFYNRQQITFEREEDFGFKTTFSIKTEDNEACGNLRFTPMNEYTAWKNIAEQSIFPQLFIQKRL